jgi:hypothetical protein
VAGGESAFEAEVGSKFCNVAIASSQDLSWHSMSSDSYIRIYSSLSEIFITISLTAVMNDHVVYVKS